MYKRALGANINPKNSVRRKRKVTDKHIKAIKDYVMSNSTRRFVVNDILKELELDLSLEKLSGSTICRILSNELNYSYK